MASSARASPLVMLLGAIFLFSTHVFAVATVLGVDLGTEYIKAALVKPGIPLEIVLTKDSRRKETSAVAFKPIQGGPKDGQFPERAYGADAIALSARFPGDVYPNLKTLLGLSIDDPVVQEYAARHPALRIQGHQSRNTALFKTDTLTAEEEAWAVEELLAMELQSIQKNAEETAGDGSTVRNIVLTVPTFYTTEEKRAVQMAAELAGLKVLSLVSDGLAVGLNYATSRQFPNINEGAKPEYHMVFDMGAGSTKATVMKFQSRTVPDVGKFNKTIQEIQVLGSGWDRTLGGDSLNYMIVDDMVSQFIESKGAKKISATSEGIKAHGRAIAKLTKEAERLRHVLSANQNTQGSFEGLYEDVDFKYKITRTAFETMAETHAEGLGAVFSEALKMAGLETDDLTSVILHGGASRTPFVQKALEKAAGSADKVRSNVNSDEAAVFGAGFRAAELSPSFRVKEIKISEGAMYPAGLKWTSSNDKVQRQRLWTGLSPLGGPPKEMTFTEQTDFTAALYQQVGTEDRDIKTFTTKNLTATVAAMKERYPSCVEADLSFKVGLKLRNDNGEVEIVKAAVECEAEAKETFVDGVKNLFGFGKKDQEPLKGEDSDEVPEEDAESSTTTPTDSESTTKSEADADATPSSEEAKADAKKKELVSIPVDFVLENAGVPDLTKDQTTSSKDRLKGFASSDKARLQREEALNQLEGFTYKIRDLLEGEAFTAASTEAERTKLAEKSSAASEWLYDDGADATKDEFKAKLKELQDLVSPIQSRLDEAEKRPELVTKLNDSLDQTSGFLETMRKQIEEYEEWQATSASASASASASDSEATPSADASKDFDGLEDDEPKDKTMEDVVEERGPVPPLYKREDLDAVEAVHKSTAEWLKDLVTRQDVLSATDDPVLLVRDLNAKHSQLEKAGKDLAMKGVKDFGGKAKKPTKSSGGKKKSTKVKSGTAENAQATINVGDAFDFGDGEKVLTEEDIEELLNKLRREHGEGDAGEKTGHDEL